MALQGYVVIDVSRMLPGAVLARMLLDLGARVIKVEDPSGGDPMRSAPPLAGGVGAGFQAFYRGAESVTLDLRDPEGRAAFRKLARHADVVVESFRPDTMKRWGLGHERLSATNPTLVSCSLPGFAGSARVGHDMNFTALSGLLSELPGESVPRVQLADVSTGMLACSSVLAALLSRHRTNRGMHLEQPLAMGPLPFLTWAWADASAGEPGLLGRILAGECASYRLYTCSDGRKLAVGALEPKFWVDLLEVLGLPELAGAGLDVGHDGEAAAARVAEVLGSKPSDYWLAIATERNLPITRVNGVDEAMADPAYAGLSHTVPVRGGPPLQAPGPFLAGWPVPDPKPAPQLGEHTDRIGSEFGLGNLQRAAV